MDQQAFFATPTLFKDWLKSNLASEMVLWVCYFKKHTGKASITWEESVEEALCYGWIDGLRKSINEESYKIRFTPRRKDSIWSQKNIDTIARLIKAKRIKEPGLIAYSNRKKNKSAIYSYEMEATELSVEFLKRLRNDKTAWAYYLKIPPSSKKHSNRWVMSGKKEETRERRFAILLKSCSASELVPLLRWSKKKV